MLDLFDNFSLILNLFLEASAMFNLTFSFKNCPLLLKISLLTPVKMVDIKITKTKENGAPEDV
jgi:hypothetical protein